MQLLARRAVLRFDLTIGENEQADAVGADADYVIEIVDGQILIATLEQSHDFMLSEIKLLHQIEIAAIGELPSPRE